MKILMVKYSDFILDYSLQLTTLYNKFTGYLLAIMVYVQHIQLNT